MEPIIIENLQIWPKDLGPLAWTGTMEKVNALGIGWRLPTIDEFKEVLSPNESNIPNTLHTALYWSSDEEGGDGKYAFSFKQDYHDYFNTYNKFYSRPVRDFNGDIAIDLLLKEF